MRNGKNRAYAGNRDKRVEVVKYISTKNALNEDEKTAVSLGNFWANMVDLSGNEDEEGKVIHIINRVYIIPYHPEIKTDGENMVIIDESKEFRIYYVKEIERKMQLELKCTLRE